MKKILIIFLLVSILEVEAKQNEMIPLKDWLVENVDNIGAAEGLYVSYRCIGLYTMMYSLSIDATQEGIKSLQKDIMDIQVNLLMGAEAFYNELTPFAKRDFEKNMRISVLPIVDNYQLEANKSWTNTGSYFNDYILDESEVCKVVSEGYAK